jgi:hypothetical protein
MKKPKHVPKQSSKRKTTPIVEDDDDILKTLAKDIVLHCFRNTHLENIHAGKSCGGVGGGFSDHDMKKLIIEAVDKTYTFLVGTFDNRFTERMSAGILMFRGSHSSWNEPKLIREWLQ